MTAPTMVCTDCGDDLLGQIEAVGADHRLIPCGVCGGEHCAKRGHVAELATLPVAPRRSPSRRWLVLGGPGGYMSMARLDRRRPGDVTAGWTVLAIIRRPHGWDPLGVERQRLYGIYRAVERVWSL